MKSYLIIIILIGCMYEHLDAQVSIPLKEISFRISVLDSGNKKIKGWLAKLNDSSIYVSLLPQRFNNTPLVSKNVKEINYRQMSEVTLQRKGSAGRGVLIGALSGFVVGVIAGLASGDDPMVPANQDFLGIGNSFRMTAVQKALGLGIIGGGIGTGIGALVGALVHKKFIIGGKKEKFDEMSSNVMDKAYRNN